MPNEIDTLNIQYSLIKWPTDPDDERAQARAKCIEETMYKLFQEGIFNRVLSTDRVKILDAMAASGICGVVLSKVLVNEGFEVELTVSDLREDELRNVSKWVDVAGLDRERFKFETVAADVVKLPLYLKGRIFDIVTIWGSSLPHIDVWNLPLLVSGVKELQSPHGILVIEQADLLPRILVNNLFKYILREGDAITLFDSYDSVRGVQKRLLYKLPEMSYVGSVESRLWEVSQIAALTWIFYREIDIYEHRECLDKTLRVTKVLIAREPRGKTAEWRELLSSIPEYIKG